MARPLFCTQCGTELKYRSDNKFDAHTGKPYIAYEFLECPLSEGFTDMKHDRWQYMSGANPRNGQWLPLDFVV